MGKSQRECRGSQSGAILGRGEKKEKSPPKGGSIRAPLSSDYEGKERGEAPKHAILFSLVLCLLTMPHGRHAPQTTKKKKKKKKKKTPGINQTLAVPSREVKGSLISVKKSLEIGKKLRRDKKLAYEKEPGKKKEGLRRVLSLRFSSGSTSSQNPRRKTPGKGSR